MQPGLYNANFYTLPVTYPYISRLWKQRNTLIDTFQNDADRLNVSYIHHYYPTPNSARNTPCIRCNKKYIKYIAVTSFTNWHYRCTCIPLVVSICKMENHPFQQKASEWQLGISSARADFFPGFFPGPIALADKATVTLAFKRLWVHGTCSRIIYSPRPRFQLHNTHPTCPSCSNSASSRASMTVIFFSK